VQAPLLPPKPAPLPPAPMMAAPLPPAPVAASMPPVPMAASLPPAPVSMAPSPMAAQQMQPGVVGVPDNTAGDIAKMVGPQGQVSMVTVALAGVAVLGGGAAWKFYSSWLKQKHEEKMQSMADAKEMAKANMQANDQQRQSCQTAAATCAATSKELYDRTDDLSRKLASAMEAVDALTKKVNAQEESTAKVLRVAPNMSDFEDRMQEVERAQKRLVKKLADSAE